MSHAHEESSILPQRSKELFVDRAVTQGLKRVRFLDVLRGVALCGIFPVNIAYFALLTQLVDSYGVSLPLADRVAREVTEGFFTFRFVTLFSFLFGVGIVLLMRKCERDRVSEGKVLFQRFFALLAFGAMHVLLLWYGDILIYYAVLGILVVGIGVPYFSPRGQMVLAAIAFLFPVLLLAGPLLIFSNEGIESVLFAEPEGDPAAERAAALGASGEFTTSLFRLHPEFEAAVYREGSYGRQMVLRVFTWIFAGFVGVLILLPRALGMFCFGIASAQHGWILDPDRYRSAFLWCCVIGAAVGLPLQGVATWLWLGDASGKAVLAGVTLQYLASLGMSAAYLGAVGLLCARETIPRWLRPFEAMGRMAFTQYILQSILATGFFYAWGFAKFGQLGFAELSVVVLGVWGVGLFTSTLWLRKFRQGPLEALWRRLTYFGVKPDLTPRS